MSRNRKSKIDQHIDRAAERIRRTELPAAEADAIADDVWQRLEQRLTAEADASTAEVETIRGCDDYQALIPAFLSGNLAPSRALLFEDHTRHCVPCRKALKAARAGESEDSVAAAAVRPPTSGWSVPRWAAAALVALAAGATGYFFWSSTSPHSYGAVVESAGSGLFRVATLEPVAEGDEVAVGERLRTAAGETPVLRLPDGTAVEVRERSEFAIDSTRRGTTVRIERGEVIVEAADQGRGRLYVSTDDCLVSVQGTIFGVSSGTKGSRVSVIEGEVRVDYGGEERSLFAGDRTTTYGAYGMAAASFSDELAWSQNVDRYLALLAEVQELRQALARDLPWPGLRYSSRLLDVTPDDVAFYAAFPNLAETLVEANRIVDQQVSASPLLSTWWNSDSAAEMRQMLEHVTEVFGEAGSYLGDEVVMAVASGDGSDGGDMSEPVFLAELLDAAGLRSFLESQIAEHTDGLQMDDDLVIYEGELPASLPDDGMIIWLGADTMVAGPDPGRVRAAVARVQGGGGLPAEGFKTQLAAAYADGADILVGMDLQKMGPAAELAETEGQEREALERTGILGAQNLILQHRRIDGRTHNDAVLAFDGPRRGVAAWLEEPAPMGSLAYISPDAKLAAAGVMKNPVDIFDEMLAMATAAPHDCGEDYEGECDPAAAFERMQAETGINIREDVAAALGGEVAMALDGPVLPEPAWKAIMEVYDPGKLVWAMQQMVAFANVKLAEAGKPAIEFIEEAADGRVYYGVDVPDGDNEAEPFRLAFDEGYLIAAPNRALVDRAIRFRQSGYTLETSSRFTGLLPEDGRTNFSALFYQDALSLLEPLAGRISEMELTDEQREALDALRGESDPILAYAYAEESRIVFAAAGIGDFFTSGIPGLLTMGLIERAEQPEAETAPAGDTV